LRIGLCSGGRKGTSLVSVRLEVHTRLGVGKEDRNKSGGKAVSYETGRTIKVKRKWLSTTQQQKPKEKATQEREVKRNAKGKEI
jgi:hypothetical protein